MTYGLGVGGNPKTPESFFGVSTREELNSQLYKEPHITTFGEFRQRESPKPKDSIVDLSRDVASSVYPILNPLNSSITFGKALYDTINAIQKGDEDGIEAVVCPLLKQVTQESFSAVSTGVILGGVPLLVAESFTFPPLATTIPFVVEAIPTAYANMQELSKFSGEKAEEDCHTLFRSYK
jgi:hypothetical protein